MRSFTLLLLLAGHGFGLPLVNSDFSAGLAGWTASGGGEAFVSGSLGSLAPLAASHFLVLSTGPALTQGSGNPVTMLLEQAFTLDDPATLQYSVTLTLLTDLFTGSAASALDQFAVELVSPSGPILTLWLADVSAAGFLPSPDPSGAFFTSAGSHFAEYLPAQTIQGSIVLADPGSYVLRFRVSNEVDSLFDSGMLIERVSLTSVPEPRFGFVLSLLPLLPLIRRSRVWAWLTLTPALLLAQLPAPPESPVHASIAFPTGQPKESLRVSNCDELQDALGRAGRAGTFTPASGATLAAGEWLEIRLPAGLDCTPSGSTVYYPGASGIPDHAYTDARPGLFFPARTPASAGWIVLAPEGITLPARGRRVHPAIPPGPQLPTLRFGTTYTYMQYSGSDYSCYLNELRFIQNSPMPDGAATPGLYRCQSNGAGGRAFVRLEPPASPSGPCTPGQWYRDPVSDLRLGYKRCVAGLGLRPVQLDGQGGHAITFEPGAQRYWIRGLHFTRLPDPDPTTDRVNDIAYQAGLASPSVAQARLNIPISLTRIPNTASDIVFEQCLFTAADYPSRGSGAFNLEGTRLRLLDSHLEGFAVWTDRERSLVTTASESVTIYLTDARDVMVEGNLIQGAGAGLIASSDEIWRAGSWVPSMNRDITVRRNTFIHPEKYRLGSPENLALAPAHLKTGSPSDGLYYRTRQGIEFKRGYRLLAEGNFLTGMFGTLQGAQAITVWAAPPMTVPAPSGPSDGWTLSDGVSQVILRNNITYHTASGIQVLGRRSGSELRTRAVLLENNIVDRVDSTHTARVPDAANDTWIGSCFWWRGEVTDVTLASNSCTGSRSAAHPAFLFLDDNPAWLRAGSTWTALGNLAEKTHDPDAYFFISYPPWDGETGICYHLLGGAGSCTPSFVGSNLFANRADSRTPTATVYTSFGNIFIQGLTAADHWAQHGPRNSAAGDLRLMPQSIYRSGGVGGRPRGIQENVLAAAWPLPQDLIATTGPTSLTLNFLAPAAAPGCWVAVDREDGRTAQTAMASGAAGLQILTVPGLATGQRYRFLLHCGATILGRFTAGDANSVVFRPGFGRGIDANTAGTLAITRATGAAAVRLSTTVSRSLCGVPSFDLEHRTGAGAYTPILASSTGGFQTTLGGPAGTVNQYRVRLWFPNGCAPPSLTNPVSVTY